MFTAKHNRRIQRKRNTDEQSRYSSGIGEFHPAEILLKEQHFEPKGKQYLMRFSRMKKLIHNLCVFVLLVITGCQTNSTYSEQQLIVEDQTFTLSEKSPEGTLVGQVVVVNQSNAELTYYLVSSKYSYAFTLDQSTGNLFVKDNKAICYDSVQQIALEVMVSYFNTDNSFGVFANIDISIIDEKYSVTWISDSVKEICQDAMVSNLYPTTNFGDSSYNYICAWSVNLNPLYLRSFLEFDLTSIPMAAEVEKAYLTLYNPHDTISDHAHSSGSFGSNAFYLRRVSLDWDSQTIDWENQPSFLTDGQVLLEASTSGNQDYIIDVTEMVKDMVKNPGSNFGFVMMLQDESRYRRICFASLDYPNKDLHPKLQINYLY